MQSILHKTSNHLYQSPDVIDCSEGVGLPVTVLPNALYSFWQPSEADIANILAGVPIRVGIHSKEKYMPISIEVTGEVK